MLANLHYNQESLKPFIVFRFNMIVINEEYILHCMYAKLCNHFSFKHYIRILLSLNVHGTLCLLMFLFPIE